MSLRKRDSVPGKMPANKTIKRVKRRRTVNNLMTDAGSNQVTKATTTPLVKHFFESLFSDQMSKGADDVHWNGSSTTIVGEEKMRSCVVLLKKLDARVEDKENEQCEVESTLKNPIQEESKQIHKFVKPLKENVHSNLASAVYDNLQEVNILQADLNLPTEYRKPGPKSSKKHLQNVSGISMNEMKVDASRDLAVKHLKHVSRRGRSSRNSIARLKVAEDDAPVKQISKRKSSLSATKQKSKATCEMNELPEKEDNDGEESCEKTPTEKRNKKITKRRESASDGVRTRRERKMDHDDGVQTKRLRRSERNFTGESSSQLNTTCDATDIDFHVGDFVSVQGTRGIGCIRSMWYSADEQFMFHLQWFLKSADTVLGDVGNEKEIFLTDTCDDVNSNDVREILDVSRQALTDWSEMENVVPRAGKRRSKKNENDLFYRKRYDNKVGSFYDLPECSNLPNSCSSCLNKQELENREIPTPDHELELDKCTRQCDISAIRYRDEMFRCGMSVFLTPGSMILPEQISCSRQSTQNLNKEYDETRYPEKYRKPDVPEDESMTEEPFEVGYICRMFSVKPEIRRKRDVYVQLKKFYRPQNTHLNRNEANKLDLNLLYWTEEECLVTFESVEGKCFVAYDQNLSDSVQEWSSKGPYRFYFTEAYERKTSSFIKPPNHAMKLGELERENDIGNVPDDWPSIPRPLNMMDVFAGCGGLSEGLQQSGVAVCRWAIEKSEKPAEAFQLNNEHTTVYVDDCTLLLEKIKKNKGTRLPCRGEVELLVGGPPCTGLSYMGRQTNEANSSFEDSLIGSFLNYCAFFEPKFVILENVRDFLSAGRGRVFKLTLYHLLKLNYQISFAVLQCGKYGIPQSRRRAVILAAAPGETLPSFPEATHAFPFNKNVDVSVAGQKFIPNLKWTSAAPYRAITVADALSDLPIIFNDEEELEMLYGKEPVTHFQQMLRGMNSQADDVLTDHVCKQLSDLNLIRVKYIPRQPVGDWRDLPNIEVELPDGTFTSKLRYTHRDYKNGEASNGNYRGVCACATKPKGTCSSDKKQTNTIIPWCLPHTANRHSQWNGLFGRLPWNGFFQTVVSNPLPMGKQGRVLHPSQDRIISIRECARAQGFQDSFKFSGNIIDKYHQIGNAMTPPLAKAIGFEIKKCLAKKS